MLDATIIEARELDARSADGIDVQLLWYPATDSVSVRVRDATHDTSFEVVFDPADALDAFHHPFAYASRYGVEFEAPHRAHHEPQETLA